MFKGKYHNASRPLNEIPRTDIGIFVPTNDWTFPFIRIVGTKAQRPILHRDRKSVDKSPGDRLSNSLKTFSLRFSSQQYYTVHRLNKWSEIKPKNNLIRPPRVTCWYWTLFAYCHIHIYPSIAAIYRYTVGSTRVNYVWKIVDTLNGYSPCIQHILVDRYYCKIFVIKIWIA